MTQFHKRHSAAAEKDFFSHRWLLLFVCLGNIMVSNGVTQSFSVIFVALLSDYHWGRAELSGIYALYMFVFFGAGALVGPLLDRVGPRKLLPAGCLLLGLGLLGCSLVGSPGGLYLFFGLVTPLGSCCIAWMPSSIIISSWFIRRRGMAVGLVMCGSGLGMLILIPFTQIIIDAWGWRAAFLALAGLSILVMAPLNAAFQRMGSTGANRTVAPRPAKGGTAGGRAPIPPAPASRASPASPEPENASVWTLSKAFRTRSFWMMCGAFFFTPFTTFTIVLHQVAIVVDRGFEPLYVASVLGTTGISAMAGRFLGGLFSDTIGRENAYTMFMGCGALGVIALFFLSREYPWLLWLYVGLMGLGLGVGGALFTPIMADLFQGPSLGKIMGACSVFSAFGAALGPWFAGWIHDLTGSYDWGLISVETAIWTSVAFVWLAGPRNSGRRAVPRP